MTPSLSCYLARKLFKVQTILYKKASRFITDTEVFGKLTMGSLSADPCKTCLLDPFMLAWRKSIYRKYHPMRKVSILNLQGASIGLFPASCLVCQAGTVGAVRCMRAASGQD